LVARLIRRKRTGEAAIGAGGGDQFDDDLMGEQGLASPVAGYEEKSRCSILFHLYRRWGTDLVEGAAMLSQSDTFLKERVFDPVAQRVKERRDSLLNLARFPRLGIEGWLKVEATRALLDRVKNILNNGPDLQLDDDLFVELKGATDCNPFWILGGLKYGPEPRYQRLACLFLGSGTKISDSVEKLKRNSNMVGYEIFSVGADEWIIGLIVPPADPPADDMLR
jgi:hypothetical protein